MLCYNTCMMIKLKTIFIRKRNSQITIPPHNHALFEFVYYISGTGSTLLAENTYCFKEGTYTLTPPYVVHSEVFSQNSSSLVILFEAEDYQEKLKKPLFLSNRYINITPIIEQILLEYKKKYFNYKHVIENLMEIALTNLFRKHDINNTHTPGNISDILCYIDEYFMTKINLKELSQDYGYSVNHFRKLFFRHCGTTPKDYILNLRLQYAKKLLCETDLSIGKIAENCGFGFYSEFALFFKKNTGIPPAEYRKINQL